MTPRSDQKISICALLEEFASNAKRNCFPDGFHLATSNTSMGLTRDVFKMLARQLVAFVSGLGKVYCLIFVLVWGWNHQLRKFMRESLFFISCSGLVVSSVEMIPDVEKLLPLRPSWMSKLVSGIGKLHFPEIPDWLRGLFLLVTILLLVGKFREWKASRREQIFERFVNLSLARTADLQISTSSGGGPGTTKPAQANFVYGLLASAAKLFHRKNLCFQIMLLGTDECLETRYVYPDSIEIDREFRFPLDAKSAAGVAFQEKQIVYVPIVDLRQGITKMIQKRTKEEAKEHKNATDGFGCAEDVFLRRSENSREPFKSILCVPILFDDVACGVLNLVCTSRNGFVDFDFEIGEAIARFLAFAIDRTSGRMVLPKRQGKENG